MQDEEREQKTRQIAEIFSARHPRATDGGDRRENGEAAQMVPPSSKQTRYGGVDFNLHARDIQREGLWGPSGEVETGGKAAL